MHPIGRPDGGDPFRTAQIRERVLAAWTAAPARFREDANAEEDFALGDYRDRLVIELAQNAADAAARAGAGPGRLRLTLRDDAEARAAYGGPVLVAANTGTPLSAEGVQSLATLRASAKRPETTETAETIEGTETTASAGATEASGTSQPTSADRASSTSRAGSANADDSVALTDADHGFDGAAASREVGRFGVGFAATLAVSDEPAVLSRSGGVRFSRTDSAALVAEAATDVPELAEEVRRRDGHVPTLRLPYAVEGAPPDGFDTAVVLPLRDEAAADLARRLLGEVDDALLLALPALGRIEIDADGFERVLANVTERWHVRRTSGTWTTAEHRQLFADRPSEERRQHDWWVVWAVPRDTAAAEPPGVVCAPTPTEEPLSVPALLIASVPLEPGRRHVAQGPLTDRLVAEAARAYADLLRELASSAPGEPADHVLSLVPVGLPRGTLDGALHRAILHALPQTPLLAPAEPPVAPESAEPPAPPAARVPPVPPESASTAPAETAEESARRRLLRPSDAVLVEQADAAMVEVLADVVDGIVHHPAESASGAALRALGVRRIDLADLVDELASVAEARPPAWWYRLYATLAHRVDDPLTREALGALPVPLADGKVAHGARGVLLPGGVNATTGDLGGEAATDLGAALATLAPYGLRVAHAEAAHPVLEYLGAVARRPRQLLDDGAVEAAVQDSPDAEDPDAVANAVLTLVASAVAVDELAPGDLAYLGDLALYDEDGELMPADALVLPDSVAESVLDPDEYAVLHSDLVQRWGSETLEAAGVVRTLGVVVGSDVDLGALPDELADLDGMSQWIDDITDRALGVDDPAGVVAGELRAVRDLDFVRSDAWPQVLALLAGEPVPRRALVEPARLSAPDGTVAEAVSYTGWWLRQNVVRSAYADPDAEPAVRAVLEPAPNWLAQADPGVRATLGLVREVDELDEAGAAVVLERLAEEQRAIEVDDLLRWWHGLARARAEREVETEPPARTRVLVPERLAADWRDSRTTVVDANAAVVVDAPAWLQRVDLSGVVVAPPRLAGDLADLLDLPTAAERHAGRVDPGQGGRRCEVPGFLRRFVPELPNSWWEYDALRVDGQLVDWWVDDNGVHAVGRQACANGLAWSAGRWADRHRIRAALQAPGDADRLAVDDVFNEA